MSEAQEIAARLSEARRDMAIVLADLDFEQCHQCTGTGADDVGRECPLCSGEGTLEVWTYA